MEISILFLFNSCFFDGFPDPKTVFAVQGIKGRVKKCLELSTLLLMKESDERMVMSLNFHKIPLSQYNGLILHLFYISDKHEQ